MGTMGSSACDRFITLFTPSPELWVKLTGDSKMAQRIDKGLGLDDIFLSFPPSELIRRAQDVIQPEYEGDFPIARVDCCAVLSLCTKIMLEIAARFEEVGYAMWPPQLHGFHKMVQVIEALKVSIPSAIACVRLTMYYVVGREPDRPSMAMMRAIIMKACEGKKVEDFLWKNV